MADDMARNVDDDVIIRARENGLGNVSPGRIDQGPVAGVVPVVITGVAGPVNGGRGRRLAVDLDQIGDEILGVGRAEAGDEIVAGPGVVGIVALGDVLEGAGRTRRSGRGRAEAG